MQGPGVQPLWSRIHPKFWHFHWSYQRAFRQIIIIYDLSQFNLRKLVWTSFPWCSRSGLSEWQRWMLSWRCRSGCHRQSSGTEVYAGGLFGQRGGGWRGGGRELNLEGHLLRGEQRRTCSCWCWWTDLCQRGRIWAEIYRCLNVISKILKWILYWIGRQSNSAQTGGMYFLCCNK